MSRYALSVSVINLGLGAALAVLLWVVGLPAPLVWGTVATLLNFDLYLGPLGLTIACFLPGSWPLMVLLPPVVSLFLNIIESQFVTPV